MVAVVARACAVPVVAGQAAPVPPVHTSEDDLVSRERLPAAVAPAAVVSLADHSLAAVYPSRVSADISGHSDGPVVAVAVLFDHETLAGWPGSCRSTLVTATAVAASHLARIVHIVDHILDLGIAGHTDRTDLGIAQHDRSEQEFAAASSTVALEAHTPHSNCMPSFKASAQQPIQLFLNSRTSVSRMRDVLVAIVQVVGRGVRRSVGLTLTRAGDCISRLLQRNPTTSKPVLTRNKAAQTCSRNVRRFDPSHEGRHARCLESHGDGGCFRLIRDFWASRILGTSPWH